MGAPMRKAHSGHSINAAERGWGDEGQMERSGSGVELGEGGQRSQAELCSELAPSLAGGKTTRPIPCFSRPVSPSVLWG